ncbi:type III secretion system cytoplasmic ring protein SctQ [Paraburkholderia bryophila]|uniref:type III secretion system cytoplasmic ring protein SctQ n=1 Tax=Paraburkholderia bryophila TaxID=420952 RepID=UPI00234A3CB4|nr:type III secretion system cytoplasmic ring protein SctQ [Paraburkholderia bryophila]WCM24385.1 type III secretion system cytoplasmic ring protein SctQ [Paraburkholderia bryophila]
MPQFEELTHRLTRYSPPLAALSRLLCEAPERSLFGLSGALPAAAGARSKPGHAFVRPALLSLIGDYGTLDVRFDAQRFPALESIAADDNAARRIALINLWLNPWLEAARREGLDTLRVADLVSCDVRDETAQAGERALENGLPLILNRATPPLPCVVTSVPVGLIDELKARSAAHGLTNTAANTAANPTANTVTNRHASVDRLAAFAEVRLPGRLCIARRTCPSATLNALRPRDVLLGWNVMHPCVSQQPMSALISWGARTGLRLAASVDIEGRHVTFVTEPTMTQDAFDSSAYDTTDTTGTTAYDSPTDPGAARHDQAHGSGDRDAEHPALDTLIELDVPVQLEISTLELPLATLATLQPGYLLELPIAVEDAQVRLVVHGRTIGTGRLVAIGEHLGLQIARIGSA